MDEHSLGKSGQPKINLIQTKIEKKIADPTPAAAMENYYSSPHSKLAKDKSKYLNKSLVPKQGFSLHAETRINEIQRESLFTKQTPCPYEITQFILQELANIHTQIVKAKAKLIIKAKSRGSELIEVLKQKHYERVSKRIKESCSSTECIDDNLGILQPKPLKRNEALVHSQRKRFTKVQPIKFPIERIPFYSGDHAPILIENQFKMSKKKKKALRIYNEDLTHLFIMIHGLDSSYTEMIPLMNEISIVTPNADFILPECMKRANSRAKIEKLAMMVANEILQKLEDGFEYDEIGKITFICHSLGGVVARAVLPYLLDYKDKFYGYLSMGSPHLGILNAETHIKVGVWFSEVFSSYECINQLRLADADKIEN